MKYLIYVKVQNSSQKLTILKNSEEKIKNFTENLFPKANEQEEREPNTFMRAILYAIRFEKK